MLDLEEGVCNLKQSCVLWLKVLIYHSH